MEDDSPPLASSSRLDPDPSSTGAGAGAGVGTKGKARDSGFAEDALINVYEILWREPQARKNKSWDSDGVLVVRGAEMTLRNDEDGKILGKAVVSSSAQFEPDAEFKIGGKDVQIQDRIPYAAYLAKFPSQAPSLPSQQSLSQHAPSAPSSSSHAPPRSSTSTSSSKEDDEEGEDEEMAEGEESPSTSQTKGLVGSERSDKSVGVVVGPKKRKNPWDSPEAQQQDEDDEMEVDELEIVGEEPAKVDKGKAKEVEQPRKTIGLVPKAKVVDAPIETRYYSCQWRKHSTKKRPTWDGDGVLIIAGRRATLKDKDSGRDIAHAPSSGDKFTMGDEVTVGGKVAFIEGTIEEQDFLDGKCFLKQALPPAPVKSSLFAPVATKGFFVTPVLNGPTPSLTGSKNNKVPVAKFDPKAEGAIVMRRPDKVNEAMYNKKGFPVVDVVIDPVLASSLREHQVEGVKFMYESVMGMNGTQGQGCILADEMGLGKTIQAISLIYTLLHQDPFHKGSSTGVIQRAMIACPVTLVKNWDAEIKKWLGRDRVRTFVVDGKKDVQSFCSSKHYQVLIIGYEKLRSVIDQVRVCQPPIGLVICDEGHRLKSSTSQLTIALKKLSTPRRVILSGTPMQNDLGEFHSMVDFVNPGVLDSYAAFKKIFELAILRSRAPDASAQDRKLGEARMDELSRLSRSFIIRRTGEVVQKYLPPKLEYTVFVIPTELELKLYSKILEGSAVVDLLSGRGSGSHQLSLLMTLRQLSNTPGLLMKNAKAGKSTEVLTEDVTSLFPSNVDPNDFNLSGKLLAVGSLLEKLHAGGEEKIVVVSNFTSTLDIIEKHCQKKRYPHCRLDGKTPQADRIPMVEGFNRGLRKSNFIFLLSSKSGGTGLNIIGASRLVLVDSDWNPSTDAQAMARIHRQGQTKQCVIYRFLTAGTMDEKIYQRQITKLGLSGSLMDATNKAVVADKGDAFTLNDLKDVFKLHTGVSCQTHDLLGCRCHLEDGTTASEAPSDESDEEDEDFRPVDQLLKERAGFVQASQYRQDEDDDSSKKDRKNLSILKSWLHHNCRDENAADEIEDKVLREVVFLRVADAPDEVGIQAVGGKALRGGQIGFAFAKRSG
ncbi:hypothetical protein RQP46_009787 [Phenoliferia psychrophenolica]